MAMDSKERGALVQMLSDVQLPLRRGMDLMCGLFVLHGEVGNMPREDGAFVHCIDPTGKAVRLRWDESQNAWLASGEDWEGWHPTPDAVPDLERQQTRSLVTDEMMERITGEGPPSFDAWLVLMQQRFGLAAAGRTLPPEARRRAWEAMTGSAGSLAEQLRERLQHFAATGECDCDECTAKRQASAQPSPGDVGDGVAVVEVDEEAVRVAFDKETDQGRAAALGMLWNMGSSIAQASPMSLPSGDDDGDES